MGHGGTLDPFAAGVLPVFLGHATRLVEYHTADEKEYRALVAFGARSTTDDIDGELTPVDSPPPGRDAVEAALDQFRGQIEQVPPDYSAVRVAGRHAYELARHGSKPELKPRTVTINSLELTGWDDFSADRPTATLEVRCTAGTYVRRWPATWARHLVAARISPRSRAPPAGRSGSIRRIRSTRSEKRSLVAESARCCCRRRQASTSWRG